MRTLSGGYSRTFLAALIVFFISIATVMGPTPPGTGVMKPAFCLTPAHKQGKVWCYRHTRHKEDLCRKTNLFLQPYLRNLHLQLVCSFQWRGPALCLCQHQSQLLPLWSCLQLWGLESLTFNRHTQYSAVWQHIKKKKISHNLKG